MSDNNNNNNNNNNNTNTRSFNSINIKLNQSNYPTWRPIVESYFRQQDIFYQIEYGTIEVFRVSMPSNQTTKETRYWREKAAIMVLPFVDAAPEIHADVGNGIIGVPAIAAYGLEEQEDALIVLEGNYSDCKSYEVERGKEAKEWNRHQQKAFGVLSSCVEEAIWQDVRCGKSIQIIWNQLQYIAELLDSEGLYAWGCTSIGSDFDGSINPFPEILTATGFSHLANELVEPVEIFLSSYPFKLAENKNISSIEIVDRFIYLNTVNFLQLFY